MTGAYRCQLWRPDECAGSPWCPPRCPRFIADDGTPVTIVRRDTVLMATRRDGAELGAVSLERTSRADVEIDPAAPSGLAEELIRQAIAYAHSGSHDDLAVSAPAEAASTVAAELGPGARLRPDGVLVVDLAAPAVARLSVAPARYAPTAAPARIDALLDPAVIAVVGATDRPASIGRVLMENLLASFEGEVIPVTGRHDRLFDLEAVETVAALAGRGVDLALVAVPADAVLEAVADAVAVDIPAVAILSAGFAETDAVGAGRQRLLADQLADTDCTVIGPNALGVLTSRGSMNASFAPTLPASGGLSVVSHSGAIVTAILDWANDEDVGIRDVVSLGNAVDLSPTELIRYWGADERTSVVVAYLEDLPDGRAFVEAARDVTPTTPVVALKAGTTPGGAAAATSHTGAIAGDAAGYRAAFEAAGIVHAESAQAMFDTVLAHDRSPLPAGDRIAVVTNAGGPGVLAADAIESRGATLVDLDATTIDRLEARLPAAAAVANPVDVLGDAPVERFLAALEIVLGDPAVDAVVVTSTPHPLLSVSALAAGIGEASRRYGKPVVTVFPGGALDAGHRRAFAAAGVATFPDAVRAAQTLATLARYGRRRRRPRMPHEPVDVDESVVDRVLADAAARGRSVLGVESMALLDAYGIDTPRGAVARSPAEAERLARRIDAPVALKAIGPAIAHKTDVGGVRLDVDPSEAMDAYAAVVDGTRDFAGGGDLEGVLVQEQVPPGVECIVGTVRHPRFGPVVTVGLGGVFVEHFDDFAHGLAPISAHEARELLDALDGSSILRAGSRGGDRPDLDDLADAVSRISQLGVDLEDVWELEVNPVIATADGALAVDFFAAREATGPTV